MLGALTTPLGIGSMVGALFVAGKQITTRKFIYYCFSAFQASWTLPFSFSRSFVLTIIFLVSLGIAAFHTWLQPKHFAQTHSPMVSGKYPGELHVLLSSEQLPA